MPKIIVDAEKKILEAGIELFSNYSFDEVEMKMISQKAGMAVGTLYNYFPNKNILFLHVCIYVEKVFFNDLKKILNDDTILPEEKLINFTKKFIRTKETININTNTMYSVLYNIKDFEVTREYRMMCDLKQDIKKIYITILKEIKGENIDNLYTEQSYNMLVGTALHLNDNIPNQIESNKKYLENIIRKIVIEN